MNVMEKTHYSIFSGRALCSNSKNPLARRTTSTITIVTCDECLHQAVKYHSSCLSGAYDRLLWLLGEKAPKGDVDDV